MSKRSFTVVLGFALVAVLVSGGLVASNMGFKLNFPLLGPGDAVPAQEGATSVDGTNTIALPFNRQSGVDTAKALIDDMNADGVAIQNVQLFTRGNNALCTYTGAKGSPCSTNFSLTAGLGYRAKVSSGGNYIVVGSHDPGLSLTHLGPGSAVPAQEQGATSVDGTNTYAHPYHGTATTAKELLNQIGGNVQNVQLFTRGNNALCTYTGAKGSPCSTNFTLTPGVSIRLKVSADQPHTPAHF